MSKEILIKIRDKIADRISGEYVCGNSDFVAVFDFDEEWSAYETKTARFYYGDDYIDKPFNGDRCEIPILSNIHSFEVGVFAGNLKTSTSAYVPARKSILCKGGSPAAPSPDVYAEIMEMLNEAKFPPEEIAAAVKKYIDENGIDLGDEYTDVTAQYEEYLNGGGKHADFFPTLGAGKYCVDDGFRVYRCKNIEYCGCLYSTVKTYGDDQIFTEELFIDGVKVYEMESVGDPYCTYIRNIGTPFADNDAANKKYVDYTVKNIKAKDIGALPDTTPIPSVPPALPNPHALTFTGATSGSYDGSMPVAIEIPLGSGSDKWEYLGEFNSGVKDLDTWIVDKYADDTPISLKHMYFEYDFKASESTTANTKVLLGNPAASEPFRTNCAYASKDMITTSGKKSRTGEGHYVTYVPCGDEHFYTVCLIQSSNYTLTWNIGRSAVSANVLRQCVGGIAFRSENASTGLIGANSTVKIWGVKL